MPYLILNEASRAALKCLTSDEQVRVHRALYTLLDNPKRPPGGLRVKPHRRSGLLEIRASDDLRALVKWDAENLQCVKLGHHDVLDKTGQMPVPHVGVVPETTESVEGPASDSLQRQELRRSGPLAALSDDELHRHFNVPFAWIPALRSMRNATDFCAQANLEEVLGDDAWYKLSEIFPEEQSVSTGAAPTYRATSGQLQAFTAGDIEELQYNLPASSWALVQREAAYATLVRGGPGSGKTLVALYKALHILEADRGLGLTKAPQVLYVTYAGSLATDAEERIRRLRGKVPDGLRIATIDSVAQELANKGERAMANGKRLSTTYDQSILDNAATAAIAKCKRHGAGTATFLRDEITEVIQSRNVREFAEYATIERRGRGSRLAAEDRQELWEQYVRYQSELQDRGLRDNGSMRMAALDAAQSLTDEYRYDFVVVDELQDFSSTAIAIALALAKGEGNRKHVMLVGDAAQAIYRRGFRWADVGLRIGGANVFTLQTSERLSAENLRFANAIVAPAQIDDATPPEPNNRDAAEVPRVIRDFLSPEDQYEFVATLIATAVGEKIFAPQAFAVLARQRGDLDALQRTLHRHRLPVVKFSERTFFKADAVKLVTAHSAKGLEFRNVFVCGVNDGVFPWSGNARLPDEERVEADASDCKLLYVALTRARDQLVITCGRNPSPLLQPALPYARVESAVRSPAT